MIAGTTTCPPATGSSAASSARLHRAVAALEDVARISLRSVTDNPVYVLPGREPPVRPSLFNGRVPQRHGLPGSRSPHSGLGGPGPAPRAAPGRPQHPGGVEVAGAAKCGFLSTGERFCGRGASGSHADAAPGGGERCAGRCLLPVFSAYRRQVRGAECIEACSECSQPRRARRLRHRAPAGGPARDILLEVRAVLPPARGRPSSPPARRGGDARKALARSAVSGSSAFGDVTPPPAGPSPDSAPGAERAGVA